MIRLVYVSSASRPFSQEELIELLEKSRVKNERLGITGMLLYGGGNFFQVLEGEKASVDELYATISKDERHHDCIMIDESTIEERSFKEWRMGFRYLSQEDKHRLQGFSEFLDRPMKPSEFMHHSDDIVAFLYDFKENN